MKTLVKMYKIIGIIELKINIINIIIMKKYVVRNKKTDKYLDKLGIGMADTFTLEEAEKLAKQHNGYVEEY